MFDPDTRDGRPAAVRSCAPPAAPRWALWSAAALSAAAAGSALATSRVAGSHALEAAALFPLGAAVTQGLCLVLGGAPFRVRRSVALAKGAALAAAGLAVLGGTLAALVEGRTPAPALAGGMGLALLAAQLAGVLLLMPDRAAPAIRCALAAAGQGAAAQALVVVAALGVWATGSDAPDLLVAANLAALFLLSAGQVLRQALLEWRTGEDQGALASHGLIKDLP
jgi:Co/Zn/Cd efflux system component